MSVLLKSSGEESHRLSCKLHGEGVLPVCRIVQVLTLFVALVAMSLCPEVACYRYLSGFITIRRVCNVAGMLVFVYTLLRSLITVAFYPAVAASGSVYIYLRVQKKPREAASTYKGQVRRVTVLRLGGGATIPV